MHNKAPLIWILLTFYCSLPSYFDSQIKENVLSKINQEVPRWIIDQIDSDFKDVSSLTNEMIEATFRTYPGLIARYTLKDGMITSISHNGGANHPIVHFMTYMLNELNSYLPLPDVDFLVVLEDKVIADKCLVPVLGFCKKIGEKNILLVPDYQVFHTLQPTTFLWCVDSAVLTQVEKGNLLYPWNQKIGQAIWRGSDTGGPYTIYNYQNLPRIKLTELSVKRRDLLDAKMHYLNNHDPIIRSKLHELNYLGENMSVEDHLKYKYQILIDGNTSSWPGAFWRFHSNSLVFKQNSDYIQWYYGLLKPYVHYVPFSNDLSDLIEKIEWAKQNDDEAQCIVKNANDMCAQALTYADILYYFYKVIESYAELQKLAKS